MNQMIHLPRIARIAIASGVLIAASLPYALAQTVDNTEARNQENWREAIARTSVPAEGCFEASYPSLMWSRVACTVAPNIPYLPRSGSAIKTVGNGNDYVAEVTTGLINTTVGSFPKDPGVETESDPKELGANDYSLQVNSNFISYTSDTSPCSGAALPANCRGWQQFVYASGYKMAFMQYWLISYNNTCPTGWTPDPTNNGIGCFMNSTNAVPVPPQVPITELKALKLSGSAVNGGIDTLVFTAGTEAYSTTGSDSVVELATAWTESEFNIVGDCCLSSANFNGGSSVTVKVAVSNGTASAPTCLSGAGTTGETNNLYLNPHSCIGTGGDNPYIEFTESLVTIYSFCPQPNCVDGSNPWAGLTMDSKDNLYGTTLFGGANGGGVVFKVSSMAQESTLYSFGSQPGDGTNPYAGVIMDAEGNLYGTTAEGGRGGSGTNCPYSCGTAFELTSAGTETVLYSFCAQPDCTDGYLPYAGLLMEGGNLYGITNAGGNTSNASGTIFELTPTGQESVLYAFCSHSNWPNCPDGSAPSFASLITDQNGNLYGTTFDGGVNTSECYSGCGTVFKLTPSGTETVLYSFCSQSNCVDGNNTWPSGGRTLVMDQNGNLYGTTYYGGANNAGTVFKLTSAGVESVLYSFCSQSGCKDGVNPAGLIMDATGNLYGTTYYGGANNTGTVFMVSSSGKERTLYSFGSQPGDGSGPAEGVIMGKEGNLYGTTYQGGANGYGTVFGLIP
jgi:uncharacterized repeat protein (TIGR03803 family)